MEEPTQSQPTVVEITDEMKGNNTDAKDQAIIESNENIITTDNNETVNNDDNNSKDNDDNGGNNEYDVKENKVTTDNKSTAINKFEGLLDDIHTSLKNEDDETVNDDDNDAKEHKSTHNKLKTEEHRDSYEKIRSMSTIHDVRQMSIMAPLPEPLKDYIFRPVKSIFFSDREWESFLYEDKNREDILEVIELIGEYAEGESYFDIYQICAFDSINDRKAYKSSFIQAMLCILLQLPSIIFIVYGEWIGSDKSWCNNIDNDADKFGLIVSKCLAFGYSLYVSFYIEDMFANKKRGMRCVHLTDLSNNPEFLNGLWLRIGGYYNNFASYCATMASFIIIFFAESQIDLVLNALALFFLIEIDDLLVTRFDYWKIKTFIEDLPMRDKIGFRVIDVDRDDGVRVRNIKQNGPASATQPQICDGDIIIHVKVPDYEVSDTFPDCIKTKQDFINCFKEIEDIKDEFTKVTFEMKRKVRKKEFKTFSVTITTGSASVLQEIENSKKENGKCCSKCSCKVYQYGFDFPLSTIILVARFIAPFYVGICS